VQSDDTQLRQPHFQVADFWVVTPSGKLPTFLEDHAVSIFRVTRVGLGSGHTRRQRTGNTGCDRDWPQSW